MKEIVTRIRKSRKRQGHKIYSIELDEINKASERFQGLSDAAEKTADRATKTPHIDISNISQNAKKSSEAEK